MPRVPRSVLVQADDLLEPASPSVLAASQVTERVTWLFLALYTLAFASTSLLLIAPLLVTLALKVQELAGATRAPASLALVASIGALVAMVGNPFFGRMSDRTSSRFGMRRPWMLVGLLGGTAGILVVAVAPSIPLVVLGWCVAQLFFNALLAAMVAVLPDQVPARQRGAVAGVLGVCTPVASVSGTFLVQLFAPDRLLMFLAPCAIGAVFILLFMARLKDRRLASADRPAWSFREFASTFAFDPRRAPDFAWAFGSRFLFVLAYAFLATYEAYYLIEKLGTTPSDVPRQIFLATLLQSSAVVVASVVGGRISDRTGRRKVFILTAAALYGVAMFVIAFAGGFGAFLVGVGIGGVAFGAYFAVDLALVADVLPDRRTLAKDLGVLNIAGALPFSIAPAIAPALLAIGGYAGLYSVAGAVAILGAVAIIPVRRVR